mmetsp:Transcript_88694/g.206407  ORF Transcript_88694/g.206407 Transcript_88694/m.206407 type:complete len:193 (+) Transcript_88694:74-652(+)
MQPPPPPPSMMKTSSSLGSTMAAAGRAGAAVAQRGVITISTFVQRNPAAVQVFCCMVGLALSLISALSIFNVIGHDDYDSLIDRVTDQLQNVYTFVFGLVIIVCDTKEDVINKFCSIQTKLFRYFYFLATHTGRAIFYFYVGSLTLLMLPKNDLWKIVFFCLGGSLCLLGLIQLVLRCCCRSAEEVEQRASG